MFLPLRSITEIRNHSNDNFDKYGGIWMGKEKHALKQEKKIKHENKPNSSKENESQPNINMKICEMSKNFQLESEKSSKQTKKRKMNQRTISQSELNKIEVLSIRRLPHYSSKIESGISKPYFLVFIETKQKLFFFKNLLLFLSLARS